MSSELDEPVLDGSERASEDVRLRGIVTQVRADSALHSEEEPERLLRTRLRDAGITISEDQMQGLLDDVKADATTDIAPGVQEERPK
ncbi:hypothetical protein [Leifsonia sp. SIMBA_070]|uniref:hypothetical protein n=1 Tax=Leifsonia sp. SIMBA_070 TaxID=3085810 RepID=UPI003979F938